MRLGYRGTTRSSIAPLFAFALIGCSADDVEPLGQQTSGIAGPSDGDSTDGADEPDEDDDAEPDEGGDDTGDGSVNEEVCGNGIDDDGDGAIDEQCECEAGQTQPCFPEGADDPCPGTQTCSGVGEIVSWGSCEVDLEACEPEGTTGEEEEVDPCESEDLLTTMQVLTFESPLDTLGACPWGQGDNLGQSGGVMAARHEVSLALEPPEGAVLCSTTFEVPESSMYYDDQLYVLFNDVVILAPGDWSGLLPSEDNLLDLRLAADSRHQRWRRCVLPRRRLGVPATRHAAGRQHRSRARRSHAAGRARAGRESGALHRDRRGDG